MPETRCPSGAAGKVLAVGHVRTPGREVPLRLPLHRRLLVRSRHPGRYLRPKRGHDREPGRAGHRPRGRFPGDGRPVLVGWRRLSCGLHVCCRFFLGCHFPPGCPIEGGNCRRLARCLALHGFAVRNIALRNLGRPCPGLLRCPLFHFGQLR